MKKERRPAVSVLMPVRNGLPYLKEAIDSIVDQTFTDWEMVIVDNDSTDGSADYAEERARRDSRIAVYRNEADIGVPGSLNRGLALCKGEWIARMDGDDRALPMRFERQMAFMAANPDVKAVSCFAYYIDAAGRRVSRARHDLTSRKAFERYMATNTVIGLLHPGAFISRAELLAIGGYRTEYEPSEDIDLWNRLSERGPVLVVPEYLMDYRLHTGSVVSRILHREAATERWICNLKREWVDASMLARRAGKPEPTWDKFLGAWQSAPPWRRFHQNRRLLVEILSRTGREDLASGRRLRGLTKLAVSALLRPTHLATLVKRRVVLPGVLRRASRAEPESEALIFQR